MTQTVTHLPAADPLDPTGPNVPADPTLADFQDRLTVINVDGVKKIIGSDLSDTFYVHQTRASGQIELDGGKGSDRITGALGYSHGATTNLQTGTVTQADTVTLRGASSAHWWTMASPRHAEVARSFGSHRWPRWSRASSRSR